MNFGKAIEIMKATGRVARAGWNGKGMFLYLVEAGRYPPTTPAGHMLAAEQDDGLIPYAPYIAMKTVTGEVVPWLASQTDMLADDWGAILTVQENSYEVFETEFAGSIFDVPVEAAPAEAFYTMSAMYGIDGCSGELVTKQPEPGVEDDECGCILCVMVGSLLDDSK